MKISVDTYLIMQSRQVSQILDNISRNGGDVEEIYSTAKTIVDNILEVNEVSVSALSEVPVLVPMEGKILALIHEKDGSAGVYKKLREMGLIV